MALNDNSVMVASEGFVYIAPVGTGRPNLDGFDPDSFDYGIVKVKFTGAASTFGNKLTFVIGGKTVEVPVAGEGPTIDQVNALFTKEFQPDEVMVKSGKESGGTGSDKLISTDGATLVVAKSVWDGVSENPLKVTPASGSGSSSISITTSTSVWESVGHTSQEDLPELGNDGGDKEAKGSWQKKTIREITTEAAVDYVTLKLLQVDKKALALYYGEDTSTEENVFAVTRNDAPALERALFIAFKDGDRVVGFYAPKASIRRDDAPEFSKEEFASFPIRATFIKAPGVPLYEWLF